MLEGIVKIHTNELRLHVVDKATESLVMVE